MGFTELPSCPVCLERLDPDTSGILSTHCDHSFHCSCGTKWTYLSCQVCRLCQQQDEVLSCFICGTMENLWVCLICGFVGCGRYKDKHTISHWKNTQHCYSLDLRTQQIWDYVGDTYVHRLNQSKADGKLLEMNSYCESLEGDCGSCGCSEGSEISGALFISKIEAIHADYIHLVSTQLEAQRKEYDGIEDRYSVLIELVDQKAADGFYCTFNGKNFPPAEAEVRHILFLHKMDYTESADVASTPPSGFTELPSCPVCLEIGPRYQQF